MKRYLSVSIILASVVVILYSTFGQCEENKSTRHWYRLEIQTGDSTYQCLGSSTLDEKAFAKQLEGAEYVVLDDVAYRDNTGTIKRWQEWDPKAHSRLYVNPSYVILFNPMKGDPGKTAEEAATK